MRKGISTTQAIVLVLIAGLVLSLFTLLGREGGSSSGAQAEVAATVQCAVHQWFNNITEALAGTFSNSKCTQPAFSDLSGTDQPSWANIQSFPAGCGTGSYVGTIGASPTCNFYGARVTSDVSTSSSSYSTITGLSFTGAANTNYGVTFWVWAHTTVTNPTLTVLDFSMLNLPAGATLTSMCVHDIDQQGGITASICITSTQTNTQPCGQGVGPDDCYYVGHAQVNMGANSGTVALAFKKTSGSGTTSATIKAGSWMTWGVSSN